MVVGMMKTRCKVQKLQVETFLSSHRPLQHDRAIPVTLLMSDEHNNNKSSHCTDKHVIVTSQQIGTIVVEVDSLKQLQFLLQNESIDPVSMTSCTAVAKLLT